MASDVLSKLTMDAEEAVLSCVLQSPEVLGTVAATLTPPCFGHPPHARIFAAMVEVATRGGLADLLTIAERLNERDELEKVGGKQHLAWLLDVVPSASNVAAYAEVVRDHSRKRNLLLLLEQSAALAGEGRIAPGTIAANVCVELQRFEQSNSTSTRRFALYDDVSIGGLPRPAWLIDGVLPSGALAVLFAPPKSFKSFLALDWACHIALGLSWHGRAVRQGPVVYCYAEGVVGIQQRVAAWKRHAGLTERIGVYFLPRRIGLNTPAEAAELLAEIRRTVEPAPVLIIIDTVARCLDGNENSTEDMSAFVRGCDLLRDGTGATIAPVHHEGLSAGGRLRGSSALGAAADVTIRCSRDAQRLIMECQWMKDAPEFVPVHMEALEVAASLVLVPSGATSGGLKGQRLHCLTVLHDRYTAPGATYKSWLEATALKSSSFDKARIWLKDNTFVEGGNGKWKITDAGRMALGTKNSTNSTGTPLQQSVARSSYSTPHRGYVVPPVVEQDPSPPSGDNGARRPAAGSSLGDGHKIIAIESPAGVQRDL